MHAPNSLKLHRERMTAVWSVAECFLVPLAGPLTSEVCVFWVASQPRIQPVSTLGQTKQTKTVQPPKEKQDQDQQTDPNTQEEGKISTTRMAFAAGGLDQTWT